MSVKEARFKRKMIKSEEKNLKYNLYTVETSIKSLENEVMLLLKRNINHLHSQYIR